MSLASSVEVARSTYEESERYIDALASLLNTVPPSSSFATTSRQGLKDAHVASLLLDRIVDRNSSLVYTHQDNDGLLKAEQKLLRSGFAQQENGVDASLSTSGNGADDRAMSVFYSRLQHIRAHHEKYPAAVPESFALDSEALEALIAPSPSSAVGVATDAVDRLFSGEEAGGRFLDLYEYHSQYINLKGVKRISYLLYLDKFHDLNHAEFDLSIKCQAGYLKYLTALQAYLSAFLRKIRPLENIDALLAQAEEEFDGQWQLSSVPGWEDQGRQFSHLALQLERSTATRDGETQPSLHPSPSGTSDLKSGGIWCSACQKSFAKQTVFDAHLQGGKHKKALARQQGGIFSGESKTSGRPHSGTETYLARAKKIAKTETIVRTLAEGPLSIYRVETRANVERKAALTERERQAEAEEMARAAEGGSLNDEQRRNVSGHDGEDDDEEERIYNPKKLPLGWDGRPIPVWLYKLHGLGVEFKCEICSDFAYQGRKNFDRHFTESRHAFGMRALGLPNTKHFHGVTRIEDAMTLAEKLKRQAREGAGGTEARNTAGHSAAPGDVEEVEDEQGNTYSRRDYELLKRQGLI